MKIIVYTVQVRASWEDADLWLDVGARLDLENARELRDYFAGYQDRYPGVRIVEEAITQRVLPEESRS